MNQQLKKNEVYKMVVLIIANNFRIQLKVMKFKNKKKFLSIIVIVFSRNHQTRIKN